MSLLLLLLHTQADFMNVQKIWKCIEWNMKGALNTNMDLIMRKNISMIKYKNILQKKILKIHKVCAKESIRFFLRKILRI